MALIALVAGASSGFGLMIARDLAGAGHTAYASMRDVGGKNAAGAAENGNYAKQHGVDLRSITLDVQDGSSVAAAVDVIIAEHGQIFGLLNTAVLPGRSEAQQLTPPPTSIVVQAVT